MSAPTLPVAPTKPFTTYTAAISPASVPTACFNSVEKLPVAAADAAELVADSSSPALEANQVIFKNLPFSWWIASFNDDAVQYRPVSGAVNWAFVKGGEDVHIAKEITDVVIPNRTETVTRDEKERMTTIVMKDNDCLLLTKVSPSLF